VAPALAGLIAVNSSLKDAILIICVGAWVLCFLFFLGAIYLLPRDIQDLRQQLAQRAEKERILMLEGERKEKFVPAATQD
ncbi:MAG: hypothetical protein ACK4SN_06705, partial [Bellilinea sp.]